MEISFVGFKDSPVSIFNDLAKELSSKISGLKLVQRFVPLLEDIPIVVLEETHNSDFIFVFAFTSDIEERKLLESKLIDIELQTNVRILKAVQDDDFSDLSEEEFDLQKDLLVEKYVGLIIGILFNEESFEPQDKDFSI